MPSQYSLADMFAQYLPTLFEAQGLPTATNMSLDAPAPAPPPGLPAENAELIASLNPEVQANQFGEGVEDIGYAFPNEPTDTEDINLAQLVAERDADVPQLEKSYNAEGRRDPFEPLVETPEEVAMAPAPPEETPLAPTLIPEAEEPAPTKSVEEIVTETPPAEEPSKKLSPTDEWEKIWKAQYDVDAKDIVGDELYERLQGLSEQDMTLGEIFGMMGVMATDPQGGRDLLERHEGRKADALKTLADLELAASNFRKSGLAEVARTRREEAKITQRETAIDTKIAAGERSERVKQAAEIVSEVTAQGLPGGLVNPPTSAQLNNPQEYDQWLSEASKAISQYVGKQEVLKWLYAGGTEGPGWLATQATIDPANGIKNYVESTGLFSPAEVANLEATVIPEYTQAALRMRKGQEADTALTEAKVQQSLGAVDKLNAQVTYYRKRTAQIGELTPREQAQLQVNIAQQIRFAREKQVFFAELADRYTNASITKASKRDWSGTIESYLGGIADMGTIIDDLTELEMQVTSGMQGQTMTVNDALPLASDEAVKNVMERYSEHFGSPDELYSILHSDMEPDDPKLQEARNFYFMNLLTQMNMYTNIHPNDIVRILDIEGQSLIDEYAGQNVAIPEAAAPAASQQLRGQ